MLHYKDLYKLVFDMHKSQSHIDKIVIISGYIGVQTIQHLIRLPQHIEIIVIYGMYGSERISAPLHEALVKIARYNKNIKIKYATIPIHSKIYVWWQEHTIKHVLVGSANFSASGLMNDYKEVLSDIDDPFYDNLKLYIEKVLANSMDCTNPEITVKTSPKVPKTDHKLQTFLDKGICRATLLNNQGLVSKKSGLNWCFSSGHVTEGDAYIAILREYIRMYPQLFPAKKYVDNINPNSDGRKNRENDTIELIWDDGERMLALLEGQQYDAKTGLIYPKQLSSSPKKSILGIYLRKRLGVSTDHLITKSDLKRYGRDNIDISLIGEGLYYMDFSVKQ